MGDRVRVVHDEQGRLVALKSPPPDDPDRTRREAALLATIEHPGVVAFLGLDGGGSDAPEVRTAWVGSRRASDLPRPLSPGRAAGLVLAVGAIVADLHRLGVVHRALEAGHVVLDPYGRPVLCGMGAARRVDAADDGGAAIRPSTDVAGLGRLLRQLLSTPDPDEEPEAPPAVLGRRREDRRRAGQRRALLALAVRAEDADPEARPGRQAFLASVRAAVPEAALGTTEAPPSGAVDPLVALLADTGPTAPPGGRCPAVEPGRGADLDVAHRDPLVDDRVSIRSVAPDPATVEGAQDRPGWSGAAGVPGQVVIDAPTVSAGDGPAPEPGRYDLGAETAGQLFRDLARLRPDGPEPHRPGRGGWVRTGAALAALGLASFVGLSVLRGGSGAANVTPSDGRAPSASSPSSSRPGVTGGATTPDRGPAPAAPAATGATPVVEHAGRRFAVGEPGDLAAVADWSCDGRPRAVLYRPTTGSLFVFTDWPDAGGSVETRSVTAVPGGTALVTGTSADGCPRLTVAGGGPEVDLDPELLR